VFKPSQSLVAILLSTTVVVTAALGWAGWRLLDQQRAIDEQRAREQSERVADAVAASIREKLAEAGERLSGWISRAQQAPPEIPGAVGVRVDGEGVGVHPVGGLPFAPVTIAEPRVDLFAAHELIEFGDAPDRVLTGYRTLAHHSEPHVRAGALLRLARVRRKVGDFAGAVRSYEQLTALGDVRTDGLPAELAALIGLRSTYLAMANESRAADIGQTLRRGLDEGRWLMARGPAELYRDAFPNPRPSSWQLAAALSDLWRDTAGQLPSSGHRVTSTSPAVLVLWRSNGAATVALAAFASSFLDVAGTSGAEWQVVDADGRVIAGRAAPGPDPVARIIGNYGWTLYSWAESSSPAGARSSRTILLAMMGAMLAFVWGGAYFMARALRREAAVARLRSDFVAAVSHEFRSPLTAVRQIAEMLDDDRITGEDRRRKYYRVLASEAARLQGLVETLLNFGRMEAGVARYHFVDLDAAALVRGVVDDIAPQARESGTAIEIEGLADDVRVRADQGALSVALRNLLDNAIKYSAGAGTVRVGWRRDRDRVAISVIDHGIGIPPAEQGSIFDKFVRGRAAIEANITGTGVGLAIVQQIVAAHCGEIRLDSEPGRGSTFTLLLPVAN
jgi:signal transduction histidine kinase